jgi:hypothetical protein
MPPNADSVRVIARWLADRWGYNTVPDACWKDAEELAALLAPNDGSGTL